MRPGQDLLLEFAAVRFAHQHQAFLDLRLGHDLRLVEIAVGPGGDDVGHIDGVARFLLSRWSAPASETKLFGMLGGDENVRGIVDADQIVGRRMEHQQRLAQRGEAFVELLLRHVVKEFALDGERPPGQLHFDLALFLDRVDVLLEQAGDMGGIVGRGDGHHRARFGDAVRGGEHRAAAEAMADQDRRRASTSCADGRRRRPGRRRSRKNACWRIRLRWRPSR